MKKYVILIIFITLANAFADELSNTSSESSDSSSAPQETREEQTYDEILSQIFTEFKYCSNGAFLQCKECTSEGFGIIIQDCINVTKNKTFDALDKAVRMKIKNTLEEQMYTF